MIKHLPSGAMQILLDILNDIWTHDNLPASWHQPNVVPLLKAGKNPTDPSSYRPIALTSCMCKIMERMVNSRLVWYLKRNKLISSA